MQRNIETVYRAYVNKMLQLGFIAGDEPVLGDLPAVPQFECEILTGEKIAVSSCTRKSPCLVFFSPTCPIVAMISGSSGACTK